MSRRTVRPVASTDTSGGTSLSIPDKDPHDPLRLGCLIYFAPEDTDVDPVVCYSPVFQSVDPVVQVSALASATAYLADYIARLLEQPGVRDRLLALATAKLAESQRPTGETPQ